MAVPVCFSRWFGVVPPTIVSNQPRGLGIALDLLARLAETPAINAPAAQPKSAVAGSGTGRNVTTNILPGSATVGMPTKPPKLPATKLKFAGLNVPVVPAIVAIV